MLDSTLEFITQAASNSLFVFCFCNLIIVMILIGSKPGFNFNQEGGIPLSVGTSGHRDAYKGTNSKHLFHGDRTPAHASEGSFTGSTPAEDNEGNGDNDEGDKKNNDDDEKQEEENGENDNENGEEEEKDKEEDELRRRVEEFIAKVNKEWQAERLTASPLA